VSEGTKDGSDTRRGGSRVVSFRTSGGFKLFKLARLSSWRLFEDDGHGSKRGKPRRHAVFGGQPYDIDTGDWVRMMGFGDEKQCEFDRRVGLFTMYPRQIVLV
jgi:hypothetical protein